MKGDFFTGYIPPTSSERRVSKNKEPFFYEGARLEGLALATLIATLWIVWSIPHKYKWLHDQWLRNPVNQTSR